MIDDKGYIIHYDAKDKDLRVFMQAGGKQTQVGELGKTIDANVWFRNLLRYNVMWSKVLVEPFSFKNYVIRNGRWDYKDLNSSNERVANGELQPHILGIAFYRKDTETNKGADLPDTRFLFNNETYLGVTYSGDLPRAEDLNNYHFGIVGKAFYLFDEQTLLKGAGAAEMGKAQEKGKQVPADWRPIQKVETYHAMESGEIKITVEVLQPPYGDNPDDHAWIKKGFKYYDNFFKR